MVAPTDCNTLKMPPVVAPQNRDCNAAAIEPSVQVAKSSISMAQRRSMVKGVLPAATPPAVKPTAPKIVGATRTTPAVITAAATSLLVVLLGAAIVDVSVKMITS
jgi:hypothetical protein